jgi:hypothetical protein
MSVMDIACVSPLRMLGRDPRAKLCFWRMAEIRGDWRAGQRAPHAVQHLPAMTAPFRGQLCGRLNNKPRWCNAKARWRSMVKWRLTGQDSRFSHSLLSQGYQQVWPSAMAFEGWALLAKPPAHSCLGFSKRQIQQARHPRSAWARDTTTMMPSSPFLNTPLQARD